MTAMTVVPLLLLGALELGLRVAGYGYNPDYFLPLRIGDEDYLVQNEDFSRRFFPGNVSRQPSAIRMRAHKPKGAFRIFVLGESAAMGDPEPAFGPARYMEVQLRERHPEADIEVVNVAFTAINSHVVLPIARECAEHDGDVWIVYMGNNEMVGPFGAATVLGAQSPPLAYVRCSLAVQRTRLGQLGRSLSQRIGSASAPASSWQGMQMFTESRVAPDAKERIGAYRNFEGNLHDVVAAGRRSGAQVLLNTVAVNLRESPPFANWADTRLAPDVQARLNQLLVEGRQSVADGKYPEAIKLFQETIKIDAQHAEAHFLLAHAMSAAGDSNAQKHFQAACDIDALPFRTDSVLNDAIRREAHAWGEGVKLFESAEALARHGGGSPPGNESFYEHVHFNFDGAYRLGLAWAQAVDAMLPGDVQNQQVGEWLDQEQCERLLGLTDWNRKLVVESIARRLHQPPLSNQANNAGRLEKLQSIEQACLSRMTAAAVTNANQLYGEIILRHADDHFLREGYANFLQLTGDLPGAAREWERVGKLLPHDFLPWFQAGTIQSRQGRHDEAQQNIRRALAIRSILVEGWVELGRSLAAQQKWEAALEALGRAGDLRPGDPTIWVNRARIAVAMGRRADAIGWYQQAIKAGPEYVEAHAELGDQYAQAERLDEAATAYQAALKLKPGYAKVRLNYGVVLVQQGRLAEAVDQFQEALNADPGNPVAAEYLRRTQDRINAAR